MQQAVASTVGGGPEGIDLGDHLGKVSSLDREDLDTRLTGSSGRVGDLIIKQRG